MQQPKRKEGFYVDTIKEWRVAGILRGLTDVETVILAAQMCGLALAECKTNTEGQERLLDSALGIVRTSYAGRKKVLAGYGRSAKPKIEDLVQG